ANAERVPVTVIGNGSNLLVRDGGIRGLTLQIGSRMARVAREGEDICAQAGIALATLAKQAARWGLAGLAEISGIPGTLGGATTMNAGAYGCEMSAVVTRISALTCTGDMKTLEADALDFQYRSSAILTQGLIVVQVRLHLKEAPQDDILLAMEEYTQRRRSKQPLAYPSAGSFFKRPEGHFAGALIEQSGLKGLAIGGAQVSELHAGFLINRGNATASDVLRLMQEIQRRVYDCFGVMLEAEVRILGEDITNG
ncbi:MAG: UDP-N-acetylmuramate dehydrogenase, partial [Clostridia bacterium]